MPEKQVCRIVGALPLSLPPVMADGDFLIAADAGYTLSRAFPIGVSNAFSSAATVTVHEGTVVCITDTDTER